MVQLFARLVITIFLYLNPIARGGIRKLDKEYENNSSRFKMSNVARVPSSFVINKL